MKPSTSTSRRSVALVAILLLGAAALPIHFTNGVRAFMPTDAARDRVVGAGNSKTHGSITRSAIVKLDEEFFGIREVDLSREMNQAINQVISANANVDALPQFGGTQFFKSASHFDGENFPGSMRRIADYKYKVRDLLNQNDVTNARWYLGQALHTLQDFYSHSNWVERGGTAPWDAIGDITRIQPIPSANLATCTDCERNTCTDCYDPAHNLTNLTTTVLTTGYYSGLNSATGQNENEDRVKPNLLKCSHGGRVRLRGLLGVLFGSQPDTSGRGELSNGINKDTESCEISPHYDLHGPAASVAYQATLKYITEIKDLVGLPKMQKLLGFGRTMAFAIDTTGSMWEEIEGVKQKIIQIVDSRRGTALEPAMYILMPFNDPQVGPMTITDNADTFKDALNNLSANDGGDCPELPYRAMFEAVTKIEQFGDLIMFTDAGATTADLNTWERGLELEAVRKKVKIYIVYTGSEFDCPSDPHYSVVTKRTGGKYFEIAPEEVGNVTELADLVIRPNLSSLFAAVGTLTGVSQIFPFRIDSFLPQSILVVTGTGATNIVVRRPDGSIVQATDLGVRLVPLSTGALYSIANPPLGTWTIAISGSAPLGAQSKEYASRSAADLNAKDATRAGTDQSGNFKTRSKTRKSAPASSAVIYDSVSSSGEFSISVFAESQLHLSSFEFMELNTGSPHGGLFPTPGNPVAGQLSIVSAEVYSNSEPTPHFEFRALDGTILQNFTLLEVALPMEDPLATNNSRQFLGEVTVPNVPFHVYMIGTDVNGAPYQRLVPNLVTPQQVKIRGQSLEDLYAGSTTTYSFQVTNYGPPDTFRLSAVDDQNYVRAVGPGAVYLATNETREFRTLLEVPPDATPDTLVTFYVTAETTTGEETDAGFGPIRVSAAPVLKLGIVTATPAGGDGDAVIEPDEGGALGVELLNTGTTDATNIGVNVSSLTPGVTITSSYSAYSDLAPSTAGSNAGPLSFNVAPDATCGQSIDFDLSVDYDGDDSPITYRFSIPVGYLNEPEVVSYTGPPIPIPDNDETGVSIPLTVSGLSTIADVNLRFDGDACANPPSGAAPGLEHTYVGDLVITLTSPNGTTVELMNRSATSTGLSGNDGNNLCNTVFDDETGTASLQRVTPAAAPFTGTYRAYNLLSSFSGEDPNGTWILTVSDHAWQDIGYVHAFSLLLSDAHCGSGVPAANQPPTVSLTCPASGFVTSAPGSITLTAEAADGDGTVRRVEFFNGPTRIGDSNVAPYTFTWNNVPAGNYTLIARAVDNKGAATISSSAGVKVNAPPTVSLTSPANGLLVQGPATITIEAEAADTDGGVTKVEFFADGSLIGEDTMAPYSVTWSDVPAGSYALTAKATDSDGAMTTSGAVNITVASGKIIGKVTNADGTVPIVGATIKVAQGTGVMKTTVSNEEGNYELLALPAGTYSVETSALRYVTQTRTDVTVAEGATTTVDFSLDPLPPPTITGFSPTVGTAGTAVTISGTNFDTVLANDEVKFNTTSAAVTSASQTTIATAVPTSTGSGPITITTPTGTAVSAADFFIPPSPFTPADVEYTGRMTTGEIRTVTVAASNKIGLLLFDGAVGQRISLKMSSVAFGSSTCCSVKVGIYNPNGTSLVTPTSVGTNGAFFDTKTLAQNGTYTILVDPTSTNTGSIVLTLYDVPPDATAPITADGPPVTVTTSVPGQNARLTFTGGTGQRVSLKFDNSTYGGCNSKAYVYNPDGTLLTSDTCVNSGDFIDTKTLPASGIYSIVIDPVTTVTGSLTLTLYDVPADATSNITPGGPAATATTTVPGQNARLLFNGTAGARVSLLVNTTTYGGGNSAITIFKPDGSILASDSAAYAGDFIDAMILPVDGTYAIFVDPKTFYTGSLTLSLHDASNYSAAITLNGLPLTITISSVGQNAEVTFTGTAGQRVSLGMSGVTIGTSSCCSTYVSIKKADGGDLLAPMDVGINGNGSSTLTLPLTGTYTILVDPKGASTGNMTLTLSEEMTGSITIGGPSMALGFGRPGQNARIVFAGTEGQRVSLGLSAVTIGTSSCCSTYLSVAKPDGTTLLAPIDVGTSGNGSNTLILPVTGTYSIYIDPRGASTGNATLSLSAEFTGVINIGGSSITLALTTPGQNARINFDGLAGQRVSVGMSSVTIGTSSCCSTYVSVSNPDGTTLLAPMDVGTSGNGTPTLTLPVTGSFSINIDPRGASAGQITLTLSADLSGTISIGGGSLPLSFRPGQNAQISFEGTTGQRVSLGLSGVTIGTSSCCSTYASIKNPDGSMLLATIDVGTSGAGTNTLTLPASGNYQIFIDPRGASTGNMTLTLSEEMTGTLTPGAGPVTLGFASAGQNAQLTFAGTAAQRISLNLTGVTIGTSSCCSTYISLKNPDGSFLIPQTDVGTSGKFIDTKTLSATGVYTLIVDPRSASTGNITVTLYDVPPDNNGATTIGGSPVSLTTAVPGQNAQVIFDATSGQQVTVALTSNSMGSVTVKLLKPDGTQLTTRTSSSSSFSLTTQTLPVTGTYTISIDPGSANTGNISVSLQNAQTGLLRYLIDTVWGALISAAA